MCVEWNVDNFGLDLTKSVHFDADMCKKNNFYFFPSEVLTLTFSPQICSTSDS